MRKNDNTNSIWLKIDGRLSSYIKSSLTLGFNLHHVILKDNSIYLCQWVNNKCDNMIPSFANHSVGVGGFVFNPNNNKVLVIKELGRNVWKLPGGSSDEGENISDVAYREIYEETGIKTEFISLLAMRELHNFRYYNNSDFYFISLLKPLNYDIKIQENEIAEAKWLHFETYKNEIATKSKFNTFYY